MSRRMDMIERALADKYGEDRSDAGEGLFVERALLYVETETYDIVFPPLEGMKYVPQDDSADEGASATTYKQYTRTGLAKLITERGGDVPNVKLFVKEYSHKFYRLGAAYEYTLDDLLAASFAARNNGGPLMNIDMEHAITARQAIDRALDVVAGIGSTTSTTIPGLSQGIGPDVGLLGILNQPNATTYTPAVGAGGSATWATKTPDEKIADLTGLYAAIVSSTYKAFVPNIFLLPIDQYLSANGQRMGDGSDETVISFFRKIYPGVTIDSWQYCDAAGTNGTDRAVAFNNNKRFVRMMMSQRFRQQPPQYTDLRFKVITSAKTAGVISPYPISIAYMDGI